MWLCAVLIAFGWTIVGASPAMAGCGRYIVIGNPSLEAIRNMGPAAGFANQPFYAGHGRGVPPCNSPECRGQIPTTPPPAPNRTATSFERVVDLGGGVNLVFVPVSRTAVDDVARPDDAILRVAVPPPRD